MASKDPINPNVITPDNEDIRGPRFPYIQLTREIGQPTSAGASSAAPLQSIVDQALQKVLGRVPRQGDYRAFEVSLSQSFTIKEFEGRTLCEWTPRSSPARAISVRR